MTKMALMALVGSTALFTPALAQQPDQASPQQVRNDCRLLVRYLQQYERQQEASRQSEELPVTLEEARGFRRDNDQEACRDSIQQLAEAGHDVRQNRVRQTQGEQPRRTRVEVQQRAPQVSVRQPMPQIIVRQPPPTITIDQPQPEIIVRMPRPHVDVSTARPEVDVVQPEPQVHVRRPEQRRAAQVRQQGEPQVRYERTGEPRVRYRQAEGQPQVRYEQARDGQQRDSERTRETRRTPQQTEPRRQREAQQRQDRQQERQQRSAQTARQGRANAMVTAEWLEGREVYNARGNELGEVEQVVIDGSQDVHLVIAYGGFLGIGEQSSAVPLERFELQGDRLVVQGMTDDQLRALPDFDDSGFRRASSTQQASIPIWSDSETTGEQRQN